MQKKHLIWLLPLVLIGITLVLFRPGPALEEIDLFIPIQLNNVPYGLSIHRPAKNGIEVRIKGPKSITDALLKEIGHYGLDLHNINAGVQTITIRPEQLPVPEGVSIVSIQPSAITLHVENKITKKLPVTIAFTGKPASGFQISDARAQPPEALVSGPEQAIAGLEQVLTKPIDLTGASDSFKKEIALDLPEGLDTVSGSEVVIAEITLEEKIIMKTFKGIEVEGRDTQYDFAIVPSTIDIDVKGPETILEQLETENGVRVFVDLKGLKPGVYVRRAVIDLPVKTTLAGVQPEVFSVTITK